MYTNPGKLYALHALRACSAIRLGVYVIGRGGGISEKKTRPFPTRIIPEDPFFLAFSQSLSSFFLTFFKISGVVFPLPLPPEYAYACTECNA